MHKRLKEADLAHASSSATQTSLLTELNARLEETNSRIGAATSEVKVLGSRIDLYVKLRPGTFHDIDLWLQGLLSRSWG